MTNMSEKLRSLEKRNLQLYLFQMHGLNHQVKRQLVITSLCFLECSGMHTDGFDAGPSRMIAFWRQLERRRGSVVFVAFFDLQRQDGAT